MTVSSKLVGALEDVTKKWKKQRKREERERRARYRRYEALTHTGRTTLKEAARDAMEEAYLKASANDTLPANARQIYYAARPSILEVTGRDSLSDSYFTQALLPDYLREHAPDWDVVYDDRGSLVEPHTEHEVSLGTLAVRKYLRELSDGFDEEAIKLPRNRLPTRGPENRYGAILFIEKEGFMALFEEVKLAERFDLALMSTKGVSVTAARSLVDTLCSDDVRLLVLHDFDEAGFNILGTLQRDTRRYEFQNSVQVVDLGIRLEDVHENGLETEAAVSRASRWNLEENGATREEIDFLKNGQRVELNAFPSDQLVAWIEKKLERHGVRKVIPDQSCLEAAYRRALEVEQIERKIEEVRDEIHDSVDAAKMPRGLAKKVEEGLKRNPARPWDDVVAGLARASLEEGG